jgi:hypothetical protein
MEIISIAQQELGRIGNASGSTKKNSKSLKKESTRKGRPTALGDFTKKILEEHQAEKDAFIAARTAKAAAGELLYTADDSAVKKGKHSVGDAYSEDEAKKGAHLNFIAEYKSQHMDEYKAFEVKWKETHPKDSASSESDTELLADNASATGSVVDATSTTEPVKKKRVISEEQKAKMKAGREAAAEKKKSTSSTERSRSESPISAKEKAE